MQEYNEEQIRKQNLGLICPCEFYFAKSKKYLADCEARTVAYF